MNKKVGINKEEEQAGEQAAEAAEREAQRAAEQAEVVHHVPQNPDEGKDRLAKWFLTDEGKIKAFDQSERVNRSSRRRVPERRAQEPGAD